jgi:toxin-antitoxin system PIN domain toxin
MNNSTTSSFPDVNVWLAILLENHVHHGVAKAWWNAAESTIAFTRFTQISVLRLLTTAALMDGKPLTMDQAWQALDKFFTDDRVVLAPEPPDAGARFRNIARGDTASPKLWADAWLLAFAEAAGGTVITFDRGLGLAGAERLEPHDA